MHRPPNKRRLRYRLIVLYTTVPILIVLVAGLLMAHILGYRFNITSQEISRSGLLQLDSRPSGAIVTVDSRRVDGRTASRVTLASGSHTVMMERSGYRPWQKTVTIEPGKILWLNYARLIPKEVQTTELGDFPLSSTTLASQNGRTIAVLAEPNQPEITLLRIDGARVSQTAIELPDSLYEEASGGTFRLSEWSDNGRFLLVNHRYQGGSEWMVVDTQAVDRSVNISNIAKRTMSHVEFMGTESNQLYVLADRSLRVINTRTATMSAPIIQEVAEFSQNSQGIVAYTTVRDAKTKQRTVGYYTPSASAPYPIRTVYDEGSEPLRIEIGEYLRNEYVAVQYGSTIELSRVSLAASDSNRALNQGNLVTIAVPEDTTNVSFSPTNRFVLVTHPGGFMSYDLELGILSNTSLKGSGTSYQLDWLDGHLLWSNRNNQLITYEFDGTNVQEISEVATGQALTLSSDGRYIYGFKRDGDELKLMQISLVAET